MFSVVCFVFCFFSHIHFWKNVPFLWGSVHLVVVVVVVVDVVIREMYLSPPLP